MWTWERMMIINLSHNNPTAANITSAKMSAHHEIFQAAGSKPRARLSTRSRHCKRVLSSVSLQHLVSLQFSAAEQRRAHYSRRGLSPKVMSCVPWRTDDPCGVCALCGCGLKEPLLGGKRAQLNQSQSPCILLYSFHGQNSWILILIPWLCWIERTRPNICCHSDPNILNFKKHDCCLRKLANWNKWISAFYVMFQYNVTMTVTLGPKKGQQNAYMRVTSSLIKPARMVCSCGCQRTPGPLCTFSILATPILRHRMEGAPCRVQQIILPAWCSIASFVPKRKIASLLLVTQN